MKPKIIAGLTATLLVTALAACAPPPPPYSPQAMQYQPSQHERLLLDAGFNVRPADNPRRAALINRLPPHRMLVRYRGDRPVYVYSDPQSCRCLYVGNERAYQNYRSLVDQQHWVGDQYTAGRYDEPGVDWDAWDSYW